LRFEAPASALRDIADAIEHIERFTEGMDFEQFRVDLKTIAAVERKLLNVPSVSLSMSTLVRVAADQCRRTLL
jgi:uncharacterized protein with HEPN domain